MVSYEPTAWVHSNDVDNGAVGRSKLIELDALNANLDRDVVAFDWAGCDPAVCGSEVFNDNVQTRYEKKNWSSVMLMNCARCTTLSLDYVNHATGLELHQFKWLAGDHLIGEISHDWNHLVGYDLYDSDASLAHFTEGGPYFSSYRNCDYAAEWFRAYATMTSVIEKNGSVQIPKIPSQETRYDRYSNPLS